MREVFISGLNESVTKGSVVKDLCETVGPVHSVKFHRHLKTRAFLGCVSVSYTRAGGGEEAVTKLNGVMLGGNKITVELDDKGKFLKLP